MVKRSLVRVGVVSVAALALAATGCATSQPKESTPSSTTSHGFQESAPSPESTGPMRVPELKTVYFDFDKSEIRSDQRGTMKANADAIMKHSEWKLVTIQGHTDERGTEEYNLALGERRADSGKRYLENLGVPAARIVTVSLGESQPAVQGHDESAWKFNRRDEFLVSR